MRIYQGTVGYIGLGDMGGGIATRLVEVGLKLVVFDLNPAAMQALVSKGAQAAGSLQDVAAASDVIIVCVDPEAQVPKVVDELVPHMRSGQTVIIQSSVPPQWLSQMAAKVGAVGAKLFDAPVSGNNEDRKNGTLAVLTGATAEAVGPLSDLLEAIGRPMYFEALGAGEVAKLANNAIKSATRLAISEIMEYARAWGLSEENLIRAVQISSGACRAIDEWARNDEQIRSRFMMKMSLKQTLEILKTAEAKNVRLRMIEAVRDHTNDIDEARYAYITQNNS